MAMELIGMDGRRLLLDGTTQTCVEQALEDWAPSLSAGQATLRLEDGSELQGDVALAHLRRLAGGPWAEVSRVLDLLEHVWYQVLPQHRILRVANHLDHLQRVLELVEATGGKAEQLARGLFTDIRIDEAHFPAVVAAIKLSLPDMVSGSRELRQLLGKGHDATPRQFVELLVKTPVATP